MKTGVAIGQTLAAIAAFHAEAAHRNTGHPTARQALQQYFTHEQAAAFFQETAEEQRRIKADQVSVAQFLLGE